jgi:hypothetical protein
MCFRKLAYVVLGLIVYTSRCKFSNCVFIKALLADLELLIMSCTSRENRLDLIHNTTLSNLKLETCFN